MTPPSREPVSAQEKLRWRLWVPHPQISPPANVGPGFAITNHPQAYESLLVFASTMNAVADTRLEADREMAGDVERRVVMWAWGLKESAICSAEIDLPVVVGAHVTVEDVVAAFEGHNGITKLSAVCEGLEKVFAAAA